MTAFLQGCYWLYDYLLLVGPPLFLYKNNLLRRLVKICREDYRFEIEVDKIVIKKLSPVAAQLPRLTCKML